MSIHIRPATIEDAERILLIHRQAVDDLNAFVQEPDEFKATIDTKKSLIERLATAANSFLFVAENKNQVCGWVSLTGYELKKLNHVAMLGMAVDREYRGRGVGSALVKAVVISAKSNPAIRRIALAVFENNQSAVAFYKKSGFVIEGIEKNEIRFSDGTFANQIIMGMSW